MTGEPVDRLASSAYHMTKSVPRLGPLLSVMSIAAVTGTRSWIAQRLFGSVATSAAVWSHIRALALIQVGDIAWAVQVLPVRVEIWTLAMLPGGLADGGPAGVKTGPWTCTRTTIACAPPLRCRPR